MSKATLQLFKKGDKVRQSLSGTGVVTFEDFIVLKVNKKGVWLDNGVGNDPSGPFDSLTGRYIGTEFFGFHKCIEKV